MGLLAVVLLLQLGAVYLPWLNTFLGTQPLTGQDLIACIGASALILVVAELEKAWVRRKGEDFSSSKALSPAV
jgi:Ca2+-transporting ATPase